MPICPQCGSPRVDRFCAKCGASVGTKIVDRRLETTNAFVRPTTASVTPPVRKPVTAAGSPPSAARVLLPLFFVAAAGAALVLLMYTVRQAPVPVAKPIVTSVAPPSYKPLGGISWSEEKRFAESLETEANLRLVTGRAGLAIHRVDPASLDKRLVEVRDEHAQVANLRERLAVALRQAQFEGRWPVRVAGERFDTAKELQHAIDRADSYLRLSARAQDELIGASESAHHFVDGSERLMSQIQQIRTDAHLAASGQSHPDMATLREQRAKMLELSAELNDLQKNAPSEPDREKIDLPVFELGR